MRKRRSPRVVWLPPTNANSVGEVGLPVFQQFSVDIVGPALAGDFAVGEIPLTIDAQEDPLDPATSLSDIYNSGYRLRRIVGKIWCEYNSSTDDIGLPDFVLVTAGIIVRRADEASGQSYAFASGAPNLISPGEIENSADPWIWRRSWKLHRTADLKTPNNNYSQGTGGNADGPHVDQKTARIIGPEERLFLDVATYTTVNFASPNIAGVRVVTDLRLLASMRTTSGNRRNASR